MLESSLDTNLQATLDARKVRQCKSEISWAKVHDLKGIRRENERLTGHDQAQEVTTAAQEQRYAVQDREDMKSYRSEGFGLYQLVHMQAASLR